MELTLIPGADHMERRTILILAANPKDTSRIRLDQEVRDIETGLERSRHRDQYIVKPILAARVTDVRRAMLDTKPTVVHFCGHGEGDGGIIFEDDSGNSKPVGTEALANFFRLFSGSVECVVLNACYSDVQARAISQYIPWVVGMKQAVDDSDAVQFAVAFYDAVGAGKSFNFAYETARNALELTGTASGPSAPILQTGRRLPQSDPLLPQTPPSKRFPLGRLLTLLALPLIVLVALAMTIPNAQNQIQARSLTRAIAVEGLARSISAFGISDTIYATATSIAASFVPSGTVCTPLSQDFACEMVGFRDTFSALKQCVTKTTNNDGSVETGSEGRVTCNAYLRPPLAALKNAAIAIEKDRDPSNLLGAALKCILLRALNCGPTREETDAVEEFKSLYAFPPTGNIKDLLDKDPNDMSL